MRPPKCLRSTNLIPVGGKTSTSCSLYWLIICAWVLGVEAAAEGDGAQEGDELGGGGDAELHVDVLEVGADGAGGDGELVGRFHDAVAGADAGGDLRLAGGEVEPGGEVVRGGEEATRSGSAIKSRRERSAAAGPARASVLGVLLPSGRAPATSSPQSGRSPDLRCSVIGTGRPPSSRRAS